jgi:hypothetical protein
LFSGAFAELRNVTFSFALHVFPFVSHVAVRMEHSAPTGRIIHEILFLSIFQKSVDKIHVSLKSNKSNGTLHKAQHTFMIICYTIKLMHYSLFKKPSLRHLKPIKC